MRIWLTTCVGIREIEIKLFSQSQWEELLGMPGDLNDNLLGQTNHLKLFTNVADLLALARIEDIEVIEEFQGYIY